jgi:hypothetical protein
LSLNSSCSQPLWLGSVRPLPPRANENDGSRLALAAAAAADVPAAAAAAAELAPLFPALLPEAAAAALLLPAAEDELADAPVWLLLLLLWLLGLFSSSRCAMSALRYAALHSALACLLSILKLSLSILVKPPLAPKPLMPLLLLPPSDRAIGLPTAAPPQLLLLLLLQPHVPPALTLRLPLPSPMLL